MGFSFQVIIIVLSLASLFYYYYYFIIDFNLFYFSLFVELEYFFGCGIIL
jgi:hypothetical protein